MLQRGGHQHYPSLSVFLHHVVKGPKGLPFRISPRSMRLVVPLWFIGVIPTGWALYFDRFMGAAEMIGLTLVYSVAAIAALSWSIARDHRESRTPEVETEKLARETGTVMLSAMQRRTLHRSLDESVLLLLEECAGQWLRVQSMLKLEFWTAPNLPESYISVREQGRKNADRAMQEAILLFEPYLVHQHGPQPWMDVVEDTLQPFLGNRKAAPSRFMPPMYEQGRKIAEKLRDLANGIESVSEGRPPLQMEEAPTAGIDQTLLDIRALQVAEDELNQHRLRL